MDNGKRIYNSQGYRNNYEIDTKREKTLRILSIGGSTTNSYPYVPENDKIWTYLLEQMVSHQFNDIIGAEVINAGLPGGSSAEFLTSYLMKHRFLQPDIVLLELGGNDIPPCFYENYKADYSHVRAHGNGYKPRRYELFWLRSNFVKVLYAFWLNSLELVLQYVPYPLKELDENTVNRVENCEFEGFVNNTNLLIRNIQSDSALVILVPFVQVHDSLISMKEPLLNDLAKAQAVGYWKMRSKLNEIAVKNSVKIIDVSHQDFDVEDFVDLCHLNHQGEEKKARLIHQQIEKALYVITSGW